MCKKFAGFFFDTLKFAWDSITACLAQKKNECAAVKSVCMSENKINKVFEINLLIMGVKGNFHLE